MSMVFAAVDDDADDDLDLEEEEKWDKKLELGSQLRRLKVNRALCSSFRTT